MNAVSSAPSFLIGFPQSLSLLSKLGRGYVVVFAAKKDGKFRKEDKHSFVAKPDESAGLFPEAVLLKERKVDEDGRRLPEFADAEERELFEELNLQLESDLGTDRMRHYEVVYLIHEKYKDEVENVNSKFKVTYLPITENVKLALSYSVQKSETCYLEHECFAKYFLREKKGKIWRFSDWGMRRLAYKIQKAKNAHYILLNFELEAEWINDFKRMLDSDERVIRHFVMKRDRAEIDDYLPPPEFHTLRSDMNDAYDDDEEDAYKFDDEDIIYIDDDNEEEEEDSELAVGCGKTRESQRR